MHRLAFGIVASSAATSVMASHLPSGDHDINGCGLNDGAAVSRQLDLRSTRCRNQVYPLPSIAEPPREGDPLPVGGLMPRHNPVADPGAGPDRFFSLCRDFT